MLLKRLSLLAAGGALAVTLVACGSTTTPAASSSSTSAAMSSSAAMTSEMSSPAMESSPMDSSAMQSSSAMEPSGAMTSAAMAGGMVGAGCAGYAKANPTGAGSVDGMAAAKVAQAASANPLLTTLVAAVSGKVNPKVNLVDTLNGGEFTVFAPVDDAFKADVDAATLAKLKTDDKLLSTILTYHVISGQIAPDKIVGSHKTVEGQDLEVTGAGNDLKVNGTTTVICGGVKTANATVYLIDHVLMPPAK